MEQILKSNIHAAYLHLTRTRCSIDQATVAEVETYLLLDRYYIDASASELIINKIFLFVSNNECFGIYCDFIVISLYQTGSPF